MKKFRDNQRVRVHFGPLAGQVGVVRRLRHCDCGAWVQMEHRDDTLRDADGCDLFPFPADDDRGRHVLLYPWDCEREFSEAAS